MSACVGEPEGQQRALEGSGHEEVLHRAQRWMLVGDSILFLALGGKLVERKFWTGTQPVLYVICTM